MKGTVPGARLLSGRRGLRRTASAASLALVASTLVVLAVRAEGRPITDVELHDGSVWVSSSQRLLAGRLNPQIKQLDLGIVTDSGTVDIFQNGSTVFVDNQAGDRSLRSVDVAQGIVSDPVELPATVDAAFGGRTIALLDAQTGKAWVRTSNNISAFAAKTEPAVVKVARDGAVAVSTMGVAYFLDRTSGTVTSFAMGDTGLPVEQGKYELGGGIGKAAQLTVVGSTPVVYDLETGKLHRPGTKTVALVTEKPELVRLQQPSDAGSTVYVGTFEGLLSGSPTDGDLTQIKAPAIAGAPAAPLQMADCVHAAWAAPGVEVDSYTRLCDGQQAFNLPIPEVTAAADLVFRSNRKVVVLNDTAGQDSWLVDRDTLDIVNNWDDVDPNTKKQELEKQKREEIDPESENLPPVAKPDELGARPGQATILPVVNNDSDPNGDIVTVTKVKHVSGPEPLSGYALIGNDTQLQATFPGDADGSAVFRYEINDGRGGTASADATVTLRAESQNTAPELLPDRQTPLVVAQGERSETYVLADWTDADGDDLRLQSAELAGAGEGELEFRSDGTLTFIDTAGQVGKRSIEAVVSDGRGGESPTTIDVDVVATAAAAPDLTPDRAAGVAGKKFLVEPLANDRNPAGDRLTLVDVKGPSGVEIVKDATAGTFTAKTSRAGSYYLDYKAANADKTAQSVIRLDVKTPSRRNAPPVAVKDQGLLPAGGTALVDLLVNDYDPDEDVLVVQGVTVAEGVPLKASLIDKQMLRVEATGNLTKPEQVSYLVSDGEVATTGSVLITPGGAAEDNRPPVVEEDPVTSRAGSVAAVPVLDNDSDPDGDKLALHQEDVVVDDETAAAGLLVFVSGDQLKLRAPEKPGQYHFTYGVRDARGVRIASTVWLSVKADTPEDNQVPQPNPVIDRTIVGETLRVPLNVQGADPDGDALSFKGVESAPSKGRIVSAGPDWIEYEPFDGEAGTDVFGVVLEDKYGGRGVAELRIGVVARAELNQAPVALNDTLLVRPGKQTQYDVRLNDSDPDGDVPTILPELSTPPGVEAKLADAFIELDAPESDNDRPVSTSIGYTITDGLGGFGTAFFTLTSSPDAPFHAPIVRDDAADLAEVTGKQPGDVAVVRVLDNDGDLDGRVEDLRIEAVDADVSRVVGNELEVTLAADDQVIAYRVADADDQESYGFVFVSGVDSAPPVIDPETVPLETLANQPVEIDLGKHVMVRQGRTPILTTEDEVSAQNDDGSPLVGSDPSKLTFTPATDYVGPASVTFEVTDGVGLNDATGLRSLLTIPIDVLPDGNVAPTMRSVQLTVAEDGTPTELDLTATAEDANDDELTFEVTKVDGPVKAEIGDGSTLQLSSDGKPGDTATVDLTVSDGTATASAQALITVASSTRPLVTVAPIDLEGTAGDPTSIDVADFAVNPYPDKALTLSDLVVEAGDAALSGAKGTVFVVTPKKDTSGTVKVRFTVADASGDSERDVVGRATVVVAGRPEAPGRPQITTTEARSVVLTWGAPDDRGAPVTTYKVSGSHGFGQDCASTTCTLTGLDPGQEYSFTVVAINRVGESDPSAASASVTPDKMPDVMGQPQIAVEPTTMDKQLSLSWAAPNNEGSAISRYEIKMRGTTQMQTVPAGQTQYVWGGLTNGESYQFEIRAINKTPEPQDFSGPSDPMTPFGVPEVAAVPVGEALNNGAGGGRTVRATWVAPGANGDPISGYRLTTYANGSVLRTEDLPAGTTTRTYDGVENGVDYTFAVEAMNRAGYATSPSPQSSPVNPFGKAGAPTGLTEVDEGDRSARISFTAPADDGGRDIIGYDVSTNGGPTIRRNSTTIDLTFSSNDGPYTATVTSITSNEGTELRGESAKIGDLSPFGKPGAPSGSASQGYRSVNFSWNNGTANGRPIIRTEYNSGSGWSSGNSTSVATAQGDESRTIQVRTVSQGRNGGELVGESRDITGSAQPRSLTMSFEGAAATSPCTSSCRWINFSIDGLRANTNYSFTTNIKPSGGGAEVSGSVLTGGDGRGRKEHIAIFNSDTYGGEDFCVYVDGLQACRKGNS